MLICPTFRYIHIPHATSHIPHPSQQETVKSTVPERTRTVRQIWVQMFAAFLIAQIVLVAFGMYLGYMGSPMDPLAVKKLTAMRQMFLSVSALAVVACFTYVRVRLNASVVQTPQVLLRETAVSLAIGEASVLLSLVGLARLFPEQFLLSSGMVFLVDFLMILPAGLRLMAQPAPKNS